MGAKHTLQINQDLYISIWVGVGLHDYGLGLNSSFHYPKLAPGNVVFIYERGGGKPKSICLTKNWVITLEAELYFFVQLERPKAVKSWIRDKDLHGRFV